MIADEIMLQKFNVIVSEDGSVNLPEAVYEVSLDYVEQLAHQLKIDIDEAKAHNKIKSS